MAKQSRIEVKEELTITELIEVAKFIQELKKRRNNPERIWEFKGG